MKSDLLIETLCGLNKIKRPVFISGEPGVGKTSGVQDMAERVGAEYIHVHAATALVEDFGVPFLSADSDRFDYKMPHWWPEKNTSQVLCFDDMSQCGSDIQKVIANVIQQRELHGRSLPDNVHVVATGNRQQDRAGANRILGHLANRYTELEFEPDLDAWTKWAINHEVHPSVISFIRFRPGLLQQYKADRSNNPTCRSWVEGVSDVLDKVPAAAEFETFKGAVGEGAAGEYVAFRKIERSLPNVDALLRAPDTTEVPTDPATLYAISGAIAHRVTDKNFSDALVYCARMPQEFSVLTVTYAVQRDKSLANTQAFIDWSVKNQDVLW